MGQSYSSPRPGAKLQVIGAGLPRTGTASFSKALEILLDGPVYHGGTQVTLGPEHEVKTWIKVLSQWPPRDESVKQTNLDLIASRVDGYLAITDSPGATLIPELMALHPDAKVICTVRDVESWEKSMDVVAKAATMAFMRLMFWPLPSLRYFVDYVDCLRDQWFHKYGETEPVTKKSYYRHEEWLRSVVPADRLVFFDVKDGWEPLCTALDLPVPDVPFPRINDGKAIDDFAARQVRRAMARWALIVGGAAITVYGVMKMAK